MKNSRVVKTARNQPDLRPYLREFGHMKHELRLFMEGVENWFATHPDLKRGRTPVIHSVKSRLKDEEHLREKIRRKYIEDGVVSFQPEHIGRTVTDLSGVRVIHLHQKQFSQIRTCLDSKICSGDWYLAEKKAFTWDPESAEYFRTLGFEPEVRPTFYTSVHYTIRPKADSPIVCEIQIRTLFEEIWGEIDHTLNYPSPTRKRSQQEQLRVLSKLVGAGSRLLDSIFLIDN